MREPASVTASPVTDWGASRPFDLHPDLWAERRPTLETLASLNLPGGSTVLGADGYPLVWTSDAMDAHEVGELWLRLARRFPRTGLWPVCETYFDVSPIRSWSTSRYWKDPYAVAADVYDALSLPDRRDFYLEENPEWCRGLLEDYVPEAVEMTLAQASPLPEMPLERLSAPSAMEKLAVVACRRPADASLVLDFGIANGDAPPGIFASVLRSWEIRFGVVPVMLHPAWTVFETIAPPSDQVEVSRLAAEAVIFADDSAMQGGFHHVHSGPSVDAREMVGSTHWAIWWD